MSLITVKNVAGQLNITRSVVIPEPQAPHVQPNIIHQPAELTHVFVPFGAGPPVTAKKAKKASKSSSKVKDEHAEVHKRSKTAETEVAKEAAPKAKKAKKAKE